MLCVPAHAISCVHPSDVGRVVLSAERVFLDGVTIYLGDKFCIWVR